LKGEQKVSPDRSKVVVIMPAYNAAETLERTYNDLPLGVVDKVILVDDVSQDETVEIARRLGLKTVIHVQNRGYGGNQKTCYLEALKDGADIVVMLHPDYQYDSQRVPELIAPILRDEADVVLGSRFLSGGPLAGGMPIWKYVANRFLTTVENLVLGLKLSEAHTGLRAYRREVLETVPFLLNSDDFVFDTQIIAQTVAFGFRVDEIGVPTRYFEEASSVNFGQSVVYGFATLWTMLRFLLDKWGLWRCDLFRKPLRQIISRHHARDLLRTAVSEDQPPEPEPPRRIQRYDLLAVLILLLLWGLFSWRFFTPNEADRVSLPAGDFTQQFYVFRAFAYDEFRQGQFPLWMPCIYAGYPYQADPQSASLYPPLWVTMLALRAMGYGHYPLSALVVEVLAHLLAASLFTYAFLRAEGGRRPAALLGAVVRRRTSHCRCGPLCHRSGAECAGRSSTDDALCVLPHPGLLDLSDLAVVSLASTSDCRIDRCLGCGPVGRSDFALAGLQSTVHPQRSLFCPGRNRAPSARCVAILCHRLGEPLAATLRGCAVSGFGDVGCDRRQAGDQALLVGCGCGWPFPFLWGKRCPV
jgi:glycosyltransferase involved in cell wall biosynthesis